MLENWVPAEELDEFNANIVGEIVREAEYRGPVADAEFERAEAELGRPLPAAWRRYLQGESWFRSGRLGGTVVTLHPPRETVRAGGAHLAIIGDDGSARRLAFDLSHDPAPVVLVAPTSTDRPDIVPLAPDAEAFVARVESGELF
ncbi:hypothetical protein [Saccharothrix hoggarensis]|uniref:SUKH superfamily protein n=1 Tax=Saccharothrix hoggarensis TaxID=913853 RepID=A0ABW3R4U9_9PSEU